MILLFKSLIKTHWSFLMAQQVKDPALSLLWHRFTSLGTSTCWRYGQKGKKKKKKKKHLYYLSQFLSNSTFKLYFKTLFRKSRLSKLMYSDRNQMSGCFYERLTGKGVQENFLGWWKCPMSLVYICRRWLNVKLKISISLYVNYTSVLKLNTLKNSEKGSVGFTKLPKKSLGTKKGKEPFSEAIKLPLPFSFKCPLFLGCFCSSFPVFSECILIFLS